MSPFKLGSAPRKPALIVAESEESLQDTYDTGKKWPFPHGSLRDIVLRSTGIVRTVRTVVKQKDTDAEVLKQEVAIMKNLEHPNILQLLEVFEDAKSVYLVTEHCAGGTLLQSLTEAQRFSETQAALLMRQLFRAVRHMHERRLCHRHLCAECLFLATFGDVGPETLVKVGGFDLACHFEGDDRPLRQPCGAVGYMAPEVIDRDYSSPSDLWSCGVIMFYLLCGYLPFTGLTDQEITRECHRGAFFFHPVNWGHVSDCAKELIRFLLKRRASQRCSAVQALHHEWFKGPKRRLDEAGLKLLGGGPKAIDEQATDISASDLGALDLELDADPAAEDDIKSPIHVNSSFKPVLLMGGAA
uniref:Protein kinase domain-containing protein n=1 Tax=Alexandrium catenella TaxID=2925 RepID=A0A7S1Q883_ALECA